MPSPHSYAFKVTASGRGDIPSMVVQQFCSEFKKAAYYAVVLERDDNDRLHLHAGVIYKHGRTPCNVKSCYLNSAILRQWHVSNNTRVCLQVGKMRNEHWLTAYMAKTDSPLFLSNLPDNLEEIAYAFESENTIKKPMNPEFARWARMYVDSKGPLPADEGSVVCFFHKAMFVDDTLRICMDMKKLKDRCLALVLYLNREELAPGDLPYNGSGVLLGPRGMTPTRRKFLATPIIPGDQDSI